jgi:hypothetical protein
VTRQLLSVVLRPAAMHFKICRRCCQRIKLLNFLATTTCALTLNPGCCLPGPNPVACTPQVAVQVPLSMGLQRFFGVKKNGTEPDAGAHESLSKGACCNMHDPCACTNTSFNGLQGTEPDAGAKHDGSPKCRTLWAIQSTAHVRSTNYCL